MKGGVKDSSVQSNSVQVKWHLCARKSPLFCGPYHVSNFPQRCLSNSSNVHLTDDGTLSSFQGRSSGV